MKGQNLTLLFVFQYKFHGSGSQVGISTGEDEFLKEVPETVFYREASLPIPRAVQQYMAVSGKPWGGRVSYVYVRGQGGSAGSCCPEG